MENLRHLLILCCYGGIPYIDYDTHNVTSASTWRTELSDTLDPTDWIAVDSSGSLLNASVHPEILATHPELSQLIPKNADVPLDKCDLYNLTFSSEADQKLFEAGHGRLQCRCPRRRSGSACHLSPPSPTYSLQLAMEDPEHALSDQGNPFGVVLLMFMCLMVVMFAVFSMMRGCFCDCFGGFRSPFGRKESEELDPHAVSRCLEAARAHEQREKTRYAESRHPLIPSVSEGCAPYNPPVLSVGQFEVVPPPPRACSPPPSYRSLNNSLEQLHAHTKL